jgi:hypothetical protein
MNLTKSITSAAFALCVSAGSMLADSISPTSVSATLPVGGSTTVNKTVTVNAGPPTSSLVDVFFLADTTGSMGSQIAAIQSAASSILSQAAGLGNVAFGVGEYKDQLATSSDPFAYRLNTNITTNTANVTAGINLWSASGGGDLPEANLFGLQQAATTTSWRAGSARILVQFGDAPPHDPSGTATQATATAALIANNVKLEAIDVGSLNGTADGHTGEEGQIATATGGALITGIDTSTIVAAINAAIVNAVSTYTTVGLDLSSAPAGVTVTSSPDITGSFDRSITRTFNFTVSFTGGAPGTYNFPIYGTVDGGRVATENDHIVVTGEGTVPDSGSAFMLLGLAMAGVEAFRRKLA